MSNTQPSRGDDLLASETISELRNWIEAFVPRPKRAVILVDRLAFLLSEASAARGLPPISETSEVGDALALPVDKRTTGLDPAGQQSDPSAPATPLFKSDDEMLISLTGSAKEVVLKNPDGSTWTPSPPALPEHEGAEILTVITRIEMLIAQRDALRTEVVAALEKFGRHDPECARVGKCRCGLSESLTALRGDNAGSEGGK